MKDELRPCPFCGGNKVRFDSAWGSSVVLIYCPDCTAVISFAGNKRDTYKYSREAYNRRSDNEQRKTD